MRYTWVDCYILCWSAFISADAFHHIYQQRAWHFGGGDRAGRRQEFLSRGPKRTVHFSPTTYMKRQQSGGVVGLPQNSHVIYDNLTCHSWSASRVRLLDLASQLRHCRNDQLELDVVHSRPRQAFCCYTYCNSSPTVHSLYRYNAVV